MNQRQRNPLASQVKAAAEAWEPISRAAMPADRWLGNYFHQHRKRFGSRDRKFISEVIYSLFRNKTFLTVWAETLTPNPSAGILVTLAAAKENFLDQKNFEEILTSPYGHSPQSSLYAALRSHSLPESLKLSSENQRLVILYSFPEWLVERWVGQFGKEKTEKLLAVSQKRPPLVIRANPLKISREKLMAQFEQIGIKTKPTLLSHFGLILEERIQIFNIALFHEGLFEVQDEGSQMLCQIMAPKPGETVWDVCAGGGGKALMIAGLMKNQGRIIATDIRSHKLEDLKKRAKRSETYNIFPADLNRMSELAAARKGFDKILIDAPCSGTGTLRRNPDAKWKLSAKRLEQHHEDQVKIIQNALPYLTSKGTLYYATCSLEPLENEQTIEVILKKNPDLERKKLSDAPDGTFRLWPDVHDTDGFFLAALQKKN